MAIDQRRRGNLRRSGGFVGVGALACLLFLDLASASFLPWWAVALLVGLWLVLMFLAAQWFSADPKRVVLLAVAGLAAWVACVVVAAAT